jgi:micrococcal nuclease
MRNTLRLFLCSLSLISAMTPATVMRIIQADAFVATINGTQQNVRLIGVRPPPPWHPIEGKNVFAEDAGELARDLLLARIVYLEFDLKRRDSTGQLLAYVWLTEPREITEQTIRDSLFNAMLILKGYAIADDRYPNERYSSYFEEFQAEARDNLRGIWSSPLALMGAPAPFGGLGAISLAIDRMSHPRGSPLAPH